MPIPEMLRDDWCLCMAVRVLKRIQDRGYMACLTGGTARRFVRAQVSAPKDLDIITNAPPEGLRDICPGYGLLPLQISGVSGVLRGKECDALGKQIDCDVVCKPDLDLLQLMSLSPLDHDCKFFVFLNVAHEPILFAPLGEMTFAYYRQSEPRLRRITDPAVVYNEDPLLMLKELRLLKEDAKGDLRLSERDERWIKEHADTIRSIHPQRLYAEMEKCFLCGVARRNLESLRDFGLLRPLISVITGQQLGHGNAHTPQGLGWQLLCDCCDAFDAATQPDRAKDDYSSAHIYAMLLAYVHLQQPGPVVVPAKEEANARVAMLFSSRLPMLCNRHATDSIASLFFEYCRKYEPRTSGSASNPCGHWSSPKEHGPQGEVRDPQQAHDENTLPSYSVR